MICGYCERYFFQDGGLARVRVLFLAFRALSRVIICTIDGNLLDREKKRCVRQKLNFDTVCVLVLETLTIVSHDAPSRWSSENNKVIHKKSAGFSAFPIRIINQMSHSIRIDVRQMSGAFWVDHDEIAQRNRKPAETIKLIKLACVAGRATRLSVSFSP